MIHVYFFIYTDIYSTSPFLQFSQIIIRNVNIRTITFGHLPSYLTSMFEDLIMQQMSSDHYKDPYEPISVMEALTIHFVCICTYILP